ncbi:MAG: hypothetical protein IPL49_17840 [Saprospirales bacterium]|nr:hypothetical protein [Saprospirales bacterium]
MAIWGSDDNINQPLTVLHNFQGQEVVLPNKVVLKNPFLDIIPFPPTPGGDRLQDLVWRRNLKVKNVSIAAIRDKVAYDVK